jgi:hypothetical protein
VGIRQWFGKQGADEVTSTRTLVCYFDPKFEDLAKSDAEVYSRFYATVEVARFENLGALYQSLAKGHDIVHIYADAGSNGSLSDPAMSSLTGTEIIEKCSVPYICPQLADVGTTHCARASISIINFQIVDRQILSVPRICRG